MFRLIRPCLFVMLVAAVSVLQLQTASATPTIYDLASSFSNVSNPNGVWSLEQGATLLTSSYSTYPTYSSGFGGGWPNNGTVPFGSTQALWVGPRARAT